MWFWISQRFGQFIHRICSPLSLTFSFLRFSTSFSEMPFPQTLSTNSVVHKVCRFSNRVLTALLEVCLQAKSYKKGKLPPCLFFKYRVLLRICLLFSIFQCSKHYPEQNEFKMNAQVTTPFS